MGACAALDVGASRSAVAVATPDRARIRLLHSLSHAVTSRARHGIQLRDRIRHHGIERCLHIH
jgi:hypothetical protein